MAKEFAETGEIACNDIDTVVTELKEVGSYV